MSTAMPTKRSLSSVLKNTRVVNLAINVPGPVAAARLHEFGAEVTKIEPVGGDPLEHHYANWYQKLHQGQHIVKLDLKNEGDRLKLDGLLAKTDLLITAMRPASLEKRSLDWPRLHKAHPRLCHVAIVGYSPPDENRPGHDLTYQAKTGLLNPPQLPRTLIADLGGAERVVSSAVLLLLEREKTKEAGLAMVALADAASAFSEARRFGLTRETGLLGGASAAYNLYETKKGWIALAAIEPEFVEKLCHLLHLQEASREGLRCIFLTRTAAEWESWGGENDIPIAELKESV